MSTRPISPGAPMRPVAFLATFALAWATLDRLAPAPPRVVGASIALVAAATVLVVCERVLGHHPPSTIPRRIGLGRPAVRALVAAGFVGTGVVATNVVGAAVLGIDLTLRRDWAGVLVGVLIFHGVAEELVWRGFAFGHLRRTHSFGASIARSIPLIAATHLPVLVTAGVGLGVLAVLSAAVTCLPLAYLWERGGRTIWGAAVVHGSVGTWQLFERGFPASFSVLILLSSIVVPLSAFCFGDRFFGAAASGDAPADPTLALPSATGSR